MCTRKHTAGCSNQTGTEMDLQCPQLKKTYTYTLRSFDFKIELHTYYLLSNYSINFIFHFLKEIYFLCLPPLPDFFHDW